MQFRITTGIPVPACYCAVDTFNAEASVSYRRAHASLLPAFITRQHARVDGSIVQLAEQNQPKFPPGTFTGAVQCFIAHTYRSMIGRELYITGFGR